jgi:hypothetical protein
MAAQYSETAGTIIPAVANEEVAGIIAGFCDKYGNAIPNTTVTAGTAATSVVTARASSSSTTADYVLMDINPGSLYSCTLDATVGTTTGSNKAGVWFTLADGTNLDESTVDHDINTTVAAIVHAYSHGLDPKNSSNVICNFIMAPYKDYLI